MISTPNHLTLPAHAKINLSLEVLGRRGDGYHDLVSVMQTVTLADSLALAPSPQLELTCSVPQLAGDDNLTMRAAQLLLQTYGERGGCAMTLQKSIPAAAGLGGGSSDAAAALTGLSRLWALPSTCRDLLPLAAQLGSDVPFFLYGGTALVEGRGERVTALPALPTTWFLLVKPPLTISTAAIFEALAPHEWGDGRATRRVAEAVSAGEPPPRGINSLQAVLFRLHPAARECYETVEEIAPGRTLVSGSGPTVVASFGSRQAALTAARQLPAGRYWLRVAASCSPRGWRVPCAAA